MSEVLEQLIGKCERNSTRVAFFIAGFGMAAWAPLIPFVKERASLSEGLLGLLLLCLGAGSFLAMPFAGYLSGRHGCRGPIIAGALMISAALPMLSYSDNFVVLALTLFLFGAGLGTVEVVANLQAILVEKAFSQTMMSGFHGMWSVGGMVGALFASLLLWLGATPLMAMVIISALILGLIGNFGKGLLPFAGEQAKSVSAFPRGVVLVLGVLNFLVFLAEGSVLDWGGIFLSADLGAEHAHAGLGYGAFAVAMTIGRLKGDKVVDALGGTRVMLIGGILSAFAFGLIVLSPSFWLAVVGFFLVGIGSSNIAPLLISAAGRQKVMAQNAAVACMTAVGYSGVVVGPALIGFFAELFSLKVAFLAIGTMFLALAASSRLVSEE
ncbi:MFS transporter [Pseudomonas sp. MOB-449]|nr:MFS transporter [Pseudomonas sp. MOB-449]